jgi:DnaA family protein
LLQACCHYAQHLGLRPFYFDLTTASNPDPDILNGIERCEIVCLDNLEVIADNSDWEYAFFNFFNLHRDHGHKLITAASCPPSMLKIQLPDLQTRINWGLTLRLKALSDQDRIEALILKAHQLGFDLAPQLGRFLVCRYDRDPQALWRMLDKINLASLAAKRKLTLPFLKQVLGQEVHDA